MNKFFSNLADSTRDRSPSATPQGLQSFNVDNLINSLLQGGDKGFSVYPGMDPLEAEKDRRLELEKLDRANRAAQEAAALERASRERLASMSDSLQRELQMGRIGADKYLSQLELAQRESEFSRDVALRTLNQNHQVEMDRIDAELGRLREAREERLLQSQLAANPADFVAYEHYKRSLGEAGTLQPTPTSQTSPTGQQTPTVQTSAGEFAQATGGGVNPNALGDQYPFNDSIIAYIPTGDGRYVPRYAHPALNPVQQLQTTMASNPGAIGNPKFGGTGRFPETTPLLPLGGQQAQQPAPTPAPSAPSEPTAPATPPPPAYTDEALAQVLASIFGAAGTNLAYNPNLQGEGQFGSTIQNPGQISRQELNRLSGSEIAILSSFLKGGITGPDGKPIPLDPSDFLNQVMRSHVPTLAEAGVPTMVR